MKHQFQYRIGKTSIYTQDQFTEAYNQKQLSVVDYLKPLTPESFLYEIYGVIVNDQNEVVKLTKHPCAPICSSSLERLKKDLALYGKAVEFPIFNRDDFNSWNYLIINSEDLTHEYINGVIKRLDNSEDI